MLEITEYGRDELLDAFNHMTEAAIAYAVCDGNDAELDGLDRTLAVEIGYFMATAEVIFGDFRLACFAVSGGSKDLTRMSQALAFYYHAKQSERRPR